MKCPDQLYTNIQIDQTCQLGGESWFIFIYFPSPSSEGGSYASYSSHIRK